MFNSETANIARFTRTIKEVPQIVFDNGIELTPNLLPEGMKTIGQAIAHGWVRNASGKWIGGPK